MKLNGMCRRVSLGIVIAGALVATAAQSAYAGYYNKSAAVNYARQYANSRNPYFPIFPEDCTNYVSQALAVGQEQFVYSGPNESWRWFYTGRYAYSKSWSVAHQLFNFILNRNRGYVIGQGVGTNWGNYNSLEPGDLIFASWNDNGWLDHVYMVTGKDWRGILVCAHTNDRFDMPFTLALSQAWYNQWRFYYVRMKTQY